METDAHEVTLRGERVLLRRASPDDADALAAILAEPDVERWWGPYDADSTLDELQSSFVIVAESEIAGWLIFDEEDWWQYPSVSFDIALTTALHGRGFGREAMRLAIAHFVACGHHRFTIDPAADNERAIRAYAALGFKPVGVLRSYERRGDEWHDGLLMDLLADEFVEG